MSASTDSSTSATAAPPGGAPRTGARRAAAALIAAWHAASARLSHAWTTPGWRRAKAAADRLLLAVSVAAIGWAAANGVFVAQRAAPNRAIALVHLASQPTLQVPGSGSGATAHTPVPTRALRGTRTEQFSISIANDGPDGVVLKGGTLTGPYLVGATALVPDATGYITPNGSIHLSGTVTVDCDAAAGPAAALAAGLSSPDRQATDLVISVADTNGTVHRTDLLIDTAAFAVQGKACTA